MKTREQVLAMMWAMLAEIENGSSVSEMLRSKIQAYVDIIDYEELPKDMIGTMIRLGMAWML